MKITKCTIQRYWHEAIYRVSIVAATLPRAGILRLSKELQANGIWGRNGCLGKSWSENGVGVGCGGMQKVQNNAF